MKLLNTMGIMIVFALSSLHMTDAASIVYYNMAVHYPIKTIKRPSLVALYKGGVYALKEGSFEIYDERDCDEFHIVITTNIKLPNSSEINGLETAEDCPYTLFKLMRKSKTREIQANHLSCAPVILGPVQLEVIEYWDIQEVKTNKQDQESNHSVIKIPDNTIIVLMNPDYITKIVSEPWKPDDIFIKLPTLIFDETIDEKSLHELATKMLFASVDFSAFNKKVTKTSKTIAQNRILSVQNPLNSYISNHPRV